MKHSKGPWQVVNMTVGYGDTAYTSPVIFAHGEEYGTSAAVCEVTAKQHGRQTRRPVEECNANAALIACAPELLAWCTELLKQLKQDHPTGMDGIKEHVKNLIKRAQGEAP